MSDDLTCLVCNDVLYDPRTLQCGHSFCRECLPFVGKGRCPTCKVFISDPPNLSLALENLVQKHKPEEFKRRVEREVNPVRFWVNEQVGINVTHHESLHPKLVYKMLKELDQIGLTKNPLCLRTLMPQSTMLRDHWICVFLMNPNLFVCPSNTLYVQIDFGVDVGALVFLQQALPPRPRVAQARFEDEAPPPPAIPIDDHPNIRGIIEKQIRENPVAFPSLTDLEKLARVSAASQAKTAPTIFLRDGVNPVESK